MKKFFVFIIIGFLLGTTAAGLLSPAMISWYFDPPTSIGVSCKEAVIWGIGAYQKLLVIGGILGLVLSALVFIATRNNNKKIPPQAT